MNNRPHILYVEDDEVLSYVTQDNLVLSGYEITHCKSGKEALSVFKKDYFDLCILDVMLPEMDGFELAVSIRKLNNQVPIIFLTAKSLKEDRIEGLKLGGDDYITKPFSIEELILKIQVFLKRKFISDLPVSGNGVLSVGIYDFDVSNLRLKREDEQIDLTQKEGDLLYLLIENKNAIIKRKEILEKIWGQDDYFMGRSMDVFISRLRKYLKKDTRIKIENVHGVGFRMVCP